LATVVTLLVDSGLRYISKGLFSLARVELHDSHQEFNEYPKHAGQRDTESQGSG